MNQDEDGQPGGLASASILEFKNKRNDSDGAKGEAKKQVGRNHRSNGDSDSKALFLMTFMLLLASCQADSKICVHRKGSKRPSCTPEQDIVVEHGLSIEVHCSALGWSLVNPQFRDKGVSELQILVNNKPVEQERIIHLNENTIALSLTEPPPSKFTFGCRRRFKNIDSEQYIDYHVQVFVGFKPQKPRSFKCVSYNWENLICSWEPVPNDVPTRFSLRLQPPASLPSNEPYFDCSVPQGEPKLPKNSCLIPLWNASTDSPLKLGVENYTFVLTGENALGTDSFIYDFHHWANVVPSPPVNLTVVSKTPSSVLLHWSVPERMQDFPPGLHFRISYQNPWDYRSNWHFQTIDITNETHSNEVYFNLTNLEHENSDYHVRVSMKSSLAVDEDMWSDFSDLSFKTAAKLTCLPPKTDVGSFEIVANSYSRDVYIYWQTAPEYLETADYFPYQVVQVAENGCRSFLLPNTTTETYAKFSGLSFNSFKFEITSTACEGANNPTSTVLVPSYLDIPQKPVVFTKIARGNGVYKLSWDPPSSPDIIDCTIFWCENSRDRPYQCSGFLDWVHVAMDVNTYTAAVPNPDKVYQFAISVNTERGSSGMVWFSGMTTFSNGFRRVKSISLNRIETNSIEVGWDLGCYDHTNIVEGFNLYYCPIISALNLNCKVQKMQTTVPNPHVTDAVIDGLKPFTTYMLTISVLSETGDGLCSDPIFFTTLEAPPSPPQAVIVANATKTTMLVEWQPPSVFNGILRYYTVYYNWRPMMKVREATRAELVDVEPDNGFCVTVAACTVWCTQSEPICAESKNYTLGLPWKL